MHRFGSRKSSEENMEEEVYGLGTTHISQLVTIGLAARVMARTGRPVSIWAGR